MKRKGYLLGSIAAVWLLGLHHADACYYHFSHGLPEPTGIWPTTPDAAVALLQNQDAVDDAVVNAAVSPSPVSLSAVSLSAVSLSAVSLSAVSLSAVSLSAATPAVSPAITPLVSPTVDSYVNSWLINTTGATGRSTNATINADVDTILANVQEVAYTSTDVYIKATGIPDYNIGPFTGNPNVPENDNATFDIPRNPTPATTHTATGLGAIGVLINGVDFFNISDSMSYQNKGVWYDNAGVVEAPSFDAANAHPQQQGVYHNHENPISLESEIGANSTNPMVIGYAIDGYPLMNDYASLTPGGPIVKMMSGYELKTYSGNTRGNGGPAVSTQYPDGYFEQDYQFVGSQTLPAGESELDQYNGAFVYTPQFPNGTYAYFATTDATNTTATYPYLVGPDYCGTPMSDDTAGSVITVPANAVVYTPSVPEPSGICVVTTCALMLVARRRRFRSAADESFRFPPRISSDLS